MYHPASSAPEAWNGQQAGVVNRRKQQRMSLAVPVRVQGHDANGTPWTEMTMTENADFAGAAFTLKHSVTRGHALQLSLPLPKSFRSYDLTTPSYTVYAIVRNTTALPNGVVPGRRHVPGPASAPRPCAEPGRALPAPHRLVAGAAAGRAAAHGDSSGAPTRATTSRCSSS